MSRDNPRRPASSRAPVSRPRRVAGQGSGRPVDAEPELSVDKPPVDKPFVDEPVPTPEILTGSTGEDAVAPAEDERRGLGVLFETARATTALVSLVVVLALTAGALFTYRAVTEDDDAADPPPPQGQIAVPDGRPVLLAGADAQAAVAEAATTAETIVATSWEDYDEQVDEATALMTDDFAEEYRQTAGEIEKAFVDAKTDIEVRIVAQSVVRANRSQVQALLFLNQYVTKDGGDTTYTPYRALVTLVHTDRGWLVSGLDTK